MGNSNSSSATEKSPLSAGRSSTELHLRTTAKTMNTAATRSQEHENNTSNKTTQKCNSNQTQSSSYRVKPKHLLWGCSTIEEHYEIVRQACCGGDDQLHGLKGLKRIGFDFRKVHSSYPCSCQQQQQQQSKEIIMDEDVESLSNDDNRNNDIDGVVDDDDDDDGGSSIEDDDDEKLEDMRNIFNIKIGGSLSSNDYNNDSYRFSDRSTTDFRFSERSAATMFSLATHHSISSYEESSSSLFPRSIINIDAYNNNNDDHRNAEGGAPCSPSNDGCSLRLFHIPSNTMITEKNHQYFIAHGTMYDEVSRLCMEYAQDIMIETGNLEWVTVCPKRNIRALVSKRTSISDDDDDCDDDDENKDNSNNITTNTTIKNSSNDNNKRRRRRRPTLVIITGTGKVGAGIFSRRLSMTHGIEPATAVPFVEEAIRRDMDLIILDPNNSDTQNTMEAVEVSLERLCFQQNISSKSIEKDDDDISDDDDDHGMHILAHSMAGSQLVRFLLNKANHHENPSLSEEDKRIDGPEILHLEGYLKQIKSVAFTDSNHNINWIKKYPHLSNFFTGQQSIYFKSHKIYDDYKPLGQIHHDCQYWKHRFGTIKTLWAGTNEHALTNHTARHHIWDHFDSFR